MNNFPAEWPKIVPALVGLLLLGFMAVVGVTTFRGCSMAVTDRTEFQYDHDLPHAYESHTWRSLEALQAGVIKYAQCHAGALPPMQNPQVTLKAIKSYSKRDAKWYSSNPASEVPFTPNAALSGGQISTVSKGAILFYDADPPTGYRESYYVTIKGAIGHVPVANLPKLLMASRQSTTE